MSSPGILELPCLGRPFHLGMLYDCRSEMLIPGKTLWDFKVLQSSLQTIPKPYSNFEVIAEDTLGKKSFSLGVDAKLKLSFMGGLVQVGGAAKYLDDRKSSEQQARITLKYTSTARFEALTMEQIGSIQYPEVLDDVDATHIVSGVLYGSDAFFVFDRQLSKEEKIREVEGSMEVVVKSIPGMPEISGQASLGMKDDDRLKTDKFTCKFYGDIILPSNPSTFEEAVKVYRELPTLLSDDSGDRSVPKVVYLHPLSKLEGQSQKIIRSISNGLISKIEEIMEAFQSAEMKSNDLKKQDTCYQFTDIGCQLSRFIMLISRFKMDLVKEISELLPKIRGRGTEEKKLADIISNVYKSPFSPDQMSRFIKRKKKEIALLAQYLKNINGEHKNILNAFSSSESDILALTVDCKHDYVVCFAFNVTTSDPDYLHNLEEYLQTSKTGNDVKEWFEDGKLLSDIKRQMNRFVEFVKANLDKDNVAFAITDHSDDLITPGIDLYVNSLPEKFDPPGKPGDPQVATVTDESVSLTWTKPEHGIDSIRSYKVLYTKDEAFNSWSAYFTDETDTTACIKSLSPCTKYHFRVQAVSQPGVSVESKACSASTTGPLRPAIEMIKVSERIHSGSPEVYKLPLTKIAEDSKRGLYKFAIGSPDKTKPEKVLMLVGAAGAGKSTLINGIANYVLGVEWEDNFRFKVIFDGGKSGESDAHSQTKCVIAYTFHCTNLPFTFTIVDTPGYRITEDDNDKRGERQFLWAKFREMFRPQESKIIECDVKITEQMKHFFPLFGGNSINCINGIGFITQASLQKLTPAQQYVFDAILSKFGRNLCENIFLMATFADGHRPPVLRAIEEAGINYLKSFKFNNSAIFSKDTAEEAMFWKMGMESFDNFFKLFSMTDSKSLMPTWEVLREQEQLEILIKSVINRVTAVKRYLKSDEDGTKAFHRLQTSVYIMAKQSLRRLQEIALKPHPLYDPKCLHFLIQAEQDHEEGSLNRRKIYQRNAAILNEIIRQDD